MTNDFVMQSAEDPASKSKGTHVKEIVKRLMKGDVGGLTKRLNLSTLSFDMSPS